MAYETVSLDREAAFTDHSCISVVPLVVHPQKTSGQSGGAADWQHWQKRTRGNELKKTSSQPESLTAIAGNVRRLDYNSATPCKDAD